MKIRKLTPDSYDKAYALLNQAFPNSPFEARLVYNFHKHGKKVHEWICIHTNMIIGYIAFSNAYNGKAVCGLHLAPLAVKPEFQNQGIGSELLRFALRQEVIKAHPLFVMGDPGYFQKFGFEPCTLPICPFDQNNEHFLSIRNDTTTRYTVGYESEFTSKKTRRKKRRQ